MYIPKINDFFMSAALTLKKAMSSINLASFPGPVQLSVTYSTVLQAMKAGWGLVTRLVLVPNPKPTQCRYCSEDTHWMKLRAVCVCVCACVCVCVCVCKTGNYHFIFQI